MAGGLLTAAALGHAFGAHAFPPYRSTDAETAEAFVLEARLGLLRLRQTASTSSYSVPLLRLNYGLPANLELVTEAEFDASKGRVGDAAAGIKWVPWMRTLSFGIEALILLPINENGGVGTETQALMTARLGPTLLHLNAGGIYDARPAEAEKGWREAGSTLRFLHVAVAVSSRGEVVPGSALRVLICGDNTPESNARMLGIVQDAARCLQRKTHFTFKPHKAAPLQGALPGSLDVEVRDGDLAQMLRECDIVLTGSLTSAAVDAYCLGKPVASLLDGRSLNGSPLRGLPGVGQFANARELVSILAAAGRADAATVASAAAEPYFWLDPALPRWRALLEPRAA